MIPALSAAGQTVTNGTHWIAAPAQFFSGEFLELALVFFVLALVAAILGARGVAGISMEIARWFVIIFIVLAVLSLLL